MLFRSVLSGQSGSAGAGSSGAGDMIANAFSGMSELLSKQLDKHEEIATHLRDTKDLTDRLLKVTM